jgi:hypothetical protein
MGGLLEQLEQQNNSTRIPTAPEDVLFRNQQHALLGAEFLLKVGATG